MEAFLKMANNNTHNLKNSSHIHTSDFWCAKIAVVGLYLLLALIYLSFMFDVERSFFSPFTIGGILLVIVIGCRMVVSPFNVDKVKVEVSDPKIYRRVLKLKFKKRIFFLIIAFSYMYLVNAIVAPFLAGNPTQFYDFNFLISCIPPTLIVLLTANKDSRIKLNTEGTDDNEK